MGLESTTSSLETTPKACPTWKVFLILLAASLLGSVLIVPYAWVLTEQMDLPASPIPRELLLAIAFVVQVGIEGLLAAGAIALGLWLGGQVGWVRRC